MLTHILHDIQSKSQERGVTANPSARTALVTKVFATKKKDDESKTPRNEEIKSSNLRDKRIKVVTAASAKP